MLCRPNNSVDCGMWHGNEGRTGRRCPEGQMADSVLLESAEASPRIFSGPSQFVAQTLACLTQRLGQKSLPRIPVMSVEKLKVELHSLLIPRP